MFLRQAVLEMWDHTITTIRGLYSTWANLMLQLPSSTYPGARGSHPEPFSCMKVKYLQADTLRLLLSITGDPFRESSGLL